MTTDPPSDTPAGPAADVPPDVATHATPADAQNDAALTPPEPPSEAPADEKPAEQAPEADGAEPPKGPPTDTTNSAPEPSPAPSNKHWYVVKVQSGREETVKEAIERKVKIEGLEPFFGQVVVPMERETVTIQSGKRKGQKTVKKKKKFPGYIMAEIELNDRMRYLFRETSGVGDFVGGTLTKAPTPMSEREVAAMLRDQEDVKGMPAIKEKGKKAAAAPVKLPFSVGDKVRVRDGIFAGQEGEVKEIREPKDDTETHRIRVELTVFGRPTQVQLEHWQIENV
jgi:transcriptional antiterminator NusG